jgi:hypothetical protein
MSDTETTQQQKDAELLTALREALDSLEKNPHWLFRQAIKHVRPDGTQPALITYTRAALRTIDRLRAKAAAYDTLRAACEGVPEMLDGLAGTAQYVHGDKEYAARVFAKADAIRAAAALAAPANGDLTGATSIRPSRVVT